MPQFQSREARTAKVTVRNHTSMALDYRAVLYMGIDQVAMAEVNFRLNAGESREISLSVTMPVQIGQYPVYISVFSAGVLLAHYRSVEDVGVTIMAGMPSDSLITVVKEWTRTQLAALPWNPCADIYYTPEMNERMRQIVATIDLLQERMTTERTRLYNEALAADASYAELEAKKAEIDRIFQVMSDITFTNLFKYNNLCGISSGGMCYRTVNNVCYAGTVGDDPLYGFVGYIPDLITAEQRKIWYDWAYYWLESDSRIHSVKLIMYNQSINEGMMAIREGYYNQYTWITRKAAELFYGYWYCGYPIGY